jgi:nifR3 family TIM-barrel protein
MNATSKFEALLGSDRFPVVSAPMAEISDKAFRLIAREFGAALVWTEMVPARVLCHPTPYAKQAIDLSGETGVVVQLFGCRPNEIAAAAEVAAEAGAEAIDINMGCPVSKVVKGGAGAALMLRPELGAAIVDAVKKRVSLPLAVKLRRGWDEESRDALVVARAVVAAGADAITVHGRYRSQFFSGRADWGIIAAVKQAVGVPVIGNGDVWQPPDAGRMFKDTGCDAVMIGRAARGNPWIFTACRTYLATGREPQPPSPGERVAMAIRHCELLAAFKGESALFSMRRQADWYTRGLKGAARLRESLYRAGSFKEIKDLLAAFGLAVKGNPC